MESTSAQAMPPFDFQLQQNIPMTQQTTNESRVILYKGNGVSGSYTSDQISIDHPYTEKDMRVIQGLAIGQVLDGGLMKLESSLVVSVQEPWEPGISRIMLVFSQPGQILDAGSETQQVNLAPAFILHPGRESPHSFVNRGATLPINNSSFLEEPTIKRFNKYIEVSLTNEHPDLEQILHRVKASKAYQKYFPGLPVSVLDSNQNRQPHVDDVGNVAQELNVREQSQERDEMVVKSISEVVAELRAESNQRGNRNRKENPPNNERLN